MLSSILFTNCNFFSSDVFDFIEWIPESGENGVWQCLTCFKEFSIKSSATRHVRVSTKYQLCLMLYSISSARALYSSLLLFSSICVTGQFDCKALKEAPTFTYINELRSKMKFISMLNFYQTHRDHWYVVLYIKIEVFIWFYKVFEIFIIIC